MNEMSTPIHQLPPPTNNNAQPSDDPLLFNVINEMEQEMKKSSQPSMKMPVQMPMQMPMQMPVAHKSSIIDTEIAKRAAISALIALIIFYPATLKMVYDKFPKLEGIFTSYDLLIRATLFGIVIYILLWKLNL